MTEPIPEHIEARITAIGQQVSAEVKEVCQQMLSEGLDLQTVEKRMQEIVKRAGRQGLEVVVGEIDREREKGRQPCPTCGQEVYWKQYARR